MSAAARARLILIALVTLAGAALIALLLADSKPGPDTEAIQAGAPARAESGARGDGTPPPAAGSSLAEPERALPELIAGASGALAEPDSDRDLSALFGREALEEYSALAAQWEREGLTQSGAPRILFQEVLSAQEGLVSIRVCLDASGVEILDENGSPVGDPDTPARTATDFTLERIDGAWRIVRESIPEDPEC